TNAWVTIPDSTSLHLTTGMTIEAWVKPTAAQDFTTVAMKERSGGMSYALYGSDGTANPPSAYVHPSSAGDEAAIGTSALPLNTWSHLAATYNGSILNLYVNGALVSSQAVTGAMTTSTNPLRIGGN